MIRPICMNSVNFKGAEVKPEAEVEEQPKAEEVEVKSEDPQKGAEALGNYNAAMIQKPEVAEEVKAEEKPAEVSAEAPAETK